MTEPSSPAASRQRAIPAAQVRAVSPALAQATSDRLYGVVWQRPGLARRDRSLISFVALLARGQVAGLGYYASQALDEGVLPREVSETILHLAYYCGWGAAMAATGPVSAVFAERGITAEQLPEAAPALLALDEQAEAARAATVSGLFGETAPGLVAFTTDYLFKDLWLRPDLTARDRSLVTVAALISAGQAAQIPFHLNRAMDNGLSQEEAAEVITHLAFYAGWPNAMSALGVAREVFAQRAA